MVARAEGGSNGTPHLPSDGGKKDQNLLVEAWKNAIPVYKEYKGGTYTYPDGSSYGYKSGVRLLIRGEEVMDTAERPWANATVNAAFREFIQSRDSKNRDKPIKVLERGFGLGLTADRVLEHLDIYGGTYDVIELNSGVAKRAEEWAEFKRRPIHLPEFKVGDWINISVYEGDAIKATARRTQKVIEGKEEQADIIISDTFPIEPNEEGINDLKDLEVLKKCLSPDGVFAFFAYYPGFTGEISPLQRNLITPHFHERRYFEVPVNPPPHYHYLKTESGPVRSLPVVICKFPKI